MENPKKYGNYLYYFEYPNPSKLMGAFSPEYLGEHLGKFLDQNCRDLNIVTMQPVVYNGSTVGYWVICKKKL